MNFKPQKQRGIASLIFFAIALIIIIGGVIAKYSRSSSTGTADVSTNANVSVLLKQATDFKTGIDRMIVGGATPSTITFDATVGTGLFDPTAGAQFAIKHVPPQPLMVAPAAPLFTYSTLVKLPGIGAPTSADYVTTVGPITVQACQSINKSLYNDASTAAPAVSAGALVAWTTTPAAIDDSASVAVNYLSRPEGCVATSDAKYVYYKALVEN